MTDERRMYRMVLCHRRRADVPFVEISEHWRTFRSRLVSELREAIGFTRYTQVHRARRYDPIHQVLRWSRSPMGEALFFPSRITLAIRSWTRRPRGEALWDVVDELWFPSAEAAGAAFESGPGLEAARRLADDQASKSRHTLVFGGEERVATADGVSRGSRIKVLYLLSARPGLTPEQMRSYWGNEHQNLVVSCRREMGYVGFEQVHPAGEDTLRRAAAALGADARDAVHGVASLSFPGYGAMVGSLVSPRRVLVNRRVIGDELRFADGPRSQLIFGREHAVEP